jgi:integrase
MAIRQISDRYYVYFTWKKHRIETVTAAKSIAEAKGIEKDVKSAFRVYRFDNLDTAALEFVVKTFENKGWAMPLELGRSEPQHELTLVDAVKGFLKADQRHRAERNIYAVDRLVEHFGEAFPLKEIKVGRIKEYQRTRQQKVENGTVNRELAVLSSILRVQVEHENIDFNPCLLVKRLPANQRDSYLSWEDFNNLLDHSWWIRDLLVVLYYTGMRFNEVANLRWEMYKPDRRMLVLPADMTKEGKNPNKTRLRPKRVSSAGRAGPPNGAAPDC